MDFDFKISDEVPLWKTFDYVLKILNRINFIKGIL